MAHTLQSEPIEFDNSKESHEHITNNSSVAAQLVHKFGGPSILQEIYSIAKVALMKAGEKHPRHIANDIFARLSITLERPVWIQRTENNVTERVMISMGHIYIPIDLDEKSPAVEMEAYGGFALQLDEQSRAITGIEPLDPYHTTFG